MVVELPYTLHTRYKSIAIAWTIILIPPVIMNLALFYGLWYGKPDMDRMLVLTLPTAILGIFTVLAILERVWKLIQSSAHFRPLGASRYALDIFQWGYFVVLLCISTLITSTLAREDSDNDKHAYQIRLLSLPAAVLMYIVATLTLVSLILNRLGTKLPFRFGSCPPGTIVRPAVFYVVEDVVSVDGNGGLEYRKAFGARYDTSPVFRRLLWTTSASWALFFYVAASVFTVLVLELPVGAVYAVGWAGPFPCAGMMVVWTVAHVRKALRRERMLEGDEPRVMADEV